MSPDHQNLEQHLQSLWLRLSNRLPNRLLVLTISGIVILGGGGFALYPAHKNTNNPAVPQRIKVLKNSSDNPSTSGRPPSSTSSTPPSNPPSGTPKASNPTPAIKTPNGSGAPNDSPSNTPPPNNLPSDPTPNGVNGNWTLKFDDEFSGSSLSSPWKSGWWDASTNNTTISQSHGADNCYAPSQVGLGGGSLSFSLATLGCTTTDGSNLNYSYKSGAVNTSGTVTTSDGTNYTHSGGYYFTYGFMESRIYIPPSAGNSNTGIDWPAFWAVSNYTKGVTTPEIDVMELLNGKLCAHLHGSSGSSAVCSSTTDTSGWHTFGANWQANLITFYYDGVSIGSLTSNVPTTPVYLFLDLAASATIGNPPIVSPAVMQVDYVRVWQ